MSNHKPMSMFEVLLLGVIAILLIIACVTIPLMVR